MQGLLHQLQMQRGYRFPWVPVLLGIGIGIYFTLPFELPALSLWGLGISAAACLTLAFRQHEAYGPLWFALALVMLGPLIGAARTAQVAAPVVPFRVYGTVEGRIVNIDRSGSDKVRLTLDQVYIRRLLPRETPKYVRVSLHAEAEGFVPESGMVIRVTANLSPPDGPVEPGGFDFRKQAYFDSLGAVGYTRKPVLVLAEPDASWGLWLFRTRMKMSRAIQDGLPGPTGAFASAMMTGDRSGMTEQTVESLRVSNLAHLISISGLHMVLLTGTVFTALRFCFVLIAPLRRFINPKKTAAFGALLAGAFYLALSGAQVPTERAFIMVGVALVAVFLGRRAISLRGLAIAATIVLLERPESMTEPGFQMSFSATLALVVIFQWLTQKRMAILPGWLRPGATLVSSSLVAGLATAPFAAAHFNRIAEYGLIANLLSVPLMSIAFMPAALLWCVLAPFGLGQIALEIMRPSLWWVLKVAETV
ncbi:MAG: ComEC/Rec2 family competence protein, partial [Deltaproteobacteria bacterium]